jgi:hypothetical protein
MTYIGNDKYEVTVNNQLIQVSIEETKEMLSDMISFENKSVSGSNEFIGLTEYNTDDLINKSTFLTNQYLNELNDSERDTINDFLEEACKLQEDELNDKYVLIER